MRYIINTRSVPLTYHLPHHKIPDQTAWGILVVGAYGETWERPRLQSMICYNCQANRPEARRARVRPE